MNIKTNTDGSFTIECDGHEVTISAGGGASPPHDPAAPPTQGVAVPDPEIQVFPVPPRPRFSFVVPTTSRFPPWPYYQPPTFYLNEQFAVVGDREDWERMRYMDLQTERFKVVELRLRPGLIINMDALRAAVDRLTPAQVLLTIEAPQTDSISRTDHGYIG